MMKAHPLKRRLAVGTAATAVCLAMAAPCLGRADDGNQVLEWNQIFVETLIATNNFGDAQTFTLTTRLASGVDLPSRTYNSISEARTDGNNARVWGGMHYPRTLTRNGVGLISKNCVRSFMK